MSVCEGVGVRMCVFVFVTGQAIEYNSLSLARSVPETVILSCQHRKNLINVYLNINITKQYYLLYAGIINIYIMPVFTDRLRNIINECCTEDQIHNT